MIIGTKKLFLSVVLVLLAMTFLGKGIEENDALSIFNPVCLGQDVDMIEKSDAAEEETKASVGAEAADAKQDARIRVAIQVVKGNSFSDHEKIYVSSSEELGELKPLDCFLKLEKTGSSTNPDAEQYFFVGRLKGKLYSIDKFEVLKTEFTKGQAVITVIYTKRTNYNGLPAPAKAYFKAVLPKSIGAVKINLLQCTDDFQPLSNVSYAEKKQE